METKKTSRKYTKLQFIADKVILSVLAFFGVYMNNPSLAGIIGAYGLWSTIQFWIYTSSNNKDFEIAMRNNLPSLILEAARLGVSVPGGFPTPVPLPPADPVTNTPAPQVVTPKQYNGEE